MRILYVCVPDNLTGSDASIVSKGVIPEGGNPSIKAIHQIANTNA